MNAKKMNLNHPNSVGKSCSITINETVQGKNAHYKSQKEDDKSDQTPKIAVYLCFPKQKETGRKIIRMCNKTNYTYL